MPISTIHPINSIILTIKPKDTQLHTTLHKKKNLTHSAQKKKFTSIQSTQSTIQSSILSFNHTVNRFNQTVQTFHILADRYRLDKGQTRPKQGYPPKPPKSRF